MEIFGDYPSWMAVVALFAGFVVFAAEAGGRRTRWNEEPYDENWD
jgi:hypothetical protein